MVKLCFCCLFNSMNIFHSSHLLFFFFVKKFLYSTSIFSVNFWKWETSSKLCSIFFLLWTALFLFVKFKDEIFGHQSLDLIPWLSEGCHIPPGFSGHIHSAWMLWQSRPLAADHPVALPWSYNPGSPSVHPWARISCPHYKKVFLDKKFEFRPF